MSARWKDRCSGPRLGGWSGLLWEHSWADWWGPCTSHDLSIPYVESISLEVQWDLSSDPMWAYLSVVQWAALLVLQWAALSVVQWAALLVVQSAAQSVVQWAAQSVVQSAAQSVVQSAAQSVLHLVVLWALPLVVASVGPSPCGAAPQTRTPQIPAYSDPIISTAAHRSVGAWLGLSVGSLRSSLSGAESWTLASLAVDAYDAL